MISWLKKLFSKKNESGVMEERKNLVSPSHHLESRGLNFTIHRANGGYVLETRVYDGKYDRTNMSLHIITDDQPLGDEIGKIVTYENLRR